MAFGQSSKMLGKMVTSLIGEYNFKMYLARYKYDLLSALGDQLGKPTNIWEGYPCHKLYFTCHNNGFLHRLGAKKGFSEKEIEKYHFGRFKIAVDPLQALIARQEGFSINNFPHELIVDIGFYKKEAPKTIQDRITEAAVFYNAVFGFNYNRLDEYNGFAEGSFLDNEYLE